MRRRRTTRQATALLVAALAAAGCSHDSSVTAGAAPQHGSVALAHRVALSSQAASRLGVQTELVGRARSSSPGGPALTVIPITALIYGPEGGTWTYTASTHDAFVRQPVVIDHIDGSLVYLRSGPGAGTPVVTVGAPELLGSEYGVGEE